MKKAYKRIPVTKKTWEDLSNLKRPRQTFDNLLQDMIDLKQRDNFIKDIGEIERTGKFVPLDEAK